MKLLRVLAITVAASSFVACGGSVEQPQTQASAATKAPVGAQTHGAVKMVGEALGEVPLRTDQRTELEKLASDAESRHAGLADGRKDLANAIADQIEKGTIDRAALQPKIDRVIADFEKVHPADQAALTRMHALLDKDQRNAFVDALEAKLKDHHGEHGPMQGFAHLKQLADELKLTDDQRSQIRTVLMDAHKEGKGEHGGPHEWKARMHEGKKALESFRTDTFDAAAVGPKGDLKDKAAQGTTRIVGIAEKVLPILTPEQRKIAADKLRTLAGSGEIPF